MHGDTYSNNTIFKGKTQLVITAEQFNACFINNLITLILLKICVQWNN